MQLTLLSWWPVAKRSFPTVEVEGDALVVDVDGDMSVN
jgi:hypothetical protein